MPEGPELNLSAQFVNQICRGRVFAGRIFKSEVSRQPDIDWNEESYTISASSRGKELKLTLHTATNEDQKLMKSKKLASKTLNIVFQFGMSGKFSFYEADELQKHAHLNFFTKPNKSNGDDVKMVLSFVDYRRFGKWQPNGDWSTERGPCVLTEYLPFRENVLNNLDRTVFNKAICEVLLNQKYFNGIGNYLRAEMCYRTGIEPFQSARSVLEPLVTKDTDTKIKSEEPDILQLCHILANEVINLGGTGYDPENRDPDYSKFTEWLQCYNKDGMSNMADHNGRTMWYFGPPGPMVPSKIKERKVKKNVEKGDLKEKSEKDEVVTKEETDEKLNSTVRRTVKNGRRVTRTALNEAEQRDKQVTVKAHDDEPLPQKASCKKEQNDKPLTRLDITQAAKSKQAQKRKSSEKMKNVSAVKKTKSGKVEAKKAGEKITHTSLNGVMENGISEIIPEQREKSSQRKTTTRSRRLKSNS